MQMRLCFLNLIILNFQFDNLVQINQIKLYITSLSIYVSFLKMFLNKIANKDPSLQQVRYHTILAKNALLKIKKQKKQKKSAEQRRPLSQEFSGSLTNNLKQNMRFIQYGSSKKKKRASHSSLNNKMNLRNFDIQKMSQHHILISQKSQSKELALKDKNKRSFKDINIKTGLRQGKNLKEKQPSKQSKQKQHKIKGIKVFIGSKLKKQLQNYLLFLGLINYSLRIKYKTPQPRKYTVFIGKGNNSKLVKKIFKNRFWWKIVNHEGPEVNLIWSQWSKQNVFDMIPSVEGAHDLPIIQQNINRVKSSKSRQPKKYFFQEDYEHIYDLFPEHQKKNLIKRSKKQLSYQQLKQIVKSKKAQRIFKVELSHNHIQNHSQLTNKKNLFFNLKSYCESVHQDIFNIVPLTFHITTNLQQTQKDLQKLTEFSTNLDKKQKQKLLWIVKPGQNTNRGCGIQVFKKVQQIKTFIQKQRQKHSQRTFIIQKYISPFLFHRRKFDIRCYLLLTATPSIRAYYYPVGYIRTSSYEFSVKNCTNKLIHLTNDAIQKKNQEYGKYQKGNKVTYEEFQKYLDLFQVKKKYDFFEQILPQMKQMMIKSVKSATLLKQKSLNQSNKIHSFQLLGYDFMIDQSFKPWLIQINTNPCLQTGCQILLQLIPIVLQNAVKIAIDTVFQPPKLQEWPLNEIFTCSQSLFEQNKFQMIYSQE